MFLCVCVLENEYFKIQIVHVFSEDKKTPIMKMKWNIFIMKNAWLTDEK